MTPTLSQILPYGFERAGEIILNDKELVDFKITNPVFCEKLPQVYAWVVNDEIKYVGKAGKGVRKRLREHRGGWRGGSTTGIGKAEKLTETLQTTRVEVYARTCEVKEIELFGGLCKSEMNMISVEEDYLIKSLQPDWNTAQK